MDKFSMCFRFLECSWNHEYFGSLTSMDTSSLLGFTLTLQEAQSIHYSTNRPKIGFIAYIYIIIYISKM